jgi:hypothetical protein
MPQEGGVGRWERAATRIAIAATAVFAVACAVQFGDIVDTIYHNSDYSSTPVIAELLGQRGSGGVTLGNFLWVEPLYALRLTKWLPGHRYVWEALPFLLYALTVLTFAWSLGRTVSARAGWLAALALVCPGPIVLGLVGAPANRGPTLAHAVFLAAFLVMLPALARRRWWIRGLWAVALAVTLAPGIASDQLMILWGVVPFIAAAGVGWRTALIKGRDAVVAVGACLAGVVGGRLIAMYAEHEGVSHASFPVGFAGPEQLAKNARLVLEAMAQFVHGGFGSGGPFGVVLAAVAVVAMAAVPVLCFFLLRALRGVVSDPERPAAQRLLAIFWAVALAGTAMAVVATDVAKDAGVVRYLLISWTALLALAVIVYRQRSFALVATIAALSAVLGFGQLLRGDYTSLHGAPDGKEVAGLARFVAEHRLDHGYAGYWDAATITWASRYRALTYPVAICGAVGESVCPFGYHKLDAWYVPKRHVRTFLVYDKRDVPLNLKPPPKQWGRPFARARVGRLRLFAYGYDISAVFAGAPPTAADLRRNARAAESASREPRPSGGSSSPPRAGEPHR